MGNKIEIHRGRSHGLLEIREYFESHFTVGHQQLLHKQLRDVPGVQGIAGWVENTLHIHVDPRRNDNEVMRALRQEIRHWMAIQPLFSQKVTEVVIVR